MKRLLLIACLLVPPLAAVAGDQRYEPLADAVRTRLSAAIADRAVPTLNFRSAIDGYRWLDEMQRRLADRIPDRQVRVNLLKTIHYEALRAGLDPQLVLAVLDVESGFHKYAVSPAGARGYMQVMPFWVRLIGHPGQDLFHLRTNLRYGCVILRHYLDVEKGDYVRALGRYNGSLGQDDYARRVIRAWRNRWRYDGPTA